MGTSSPGRGAAPATPLVPSWADQPAAPAGGPLPPPGGVAPPVPVPTLPTKPEPSNGASDRWRDSRAQYTRFARSGGTVQKALFNAIATYISRSVGGSKTASRRMPASQTVASGLGGVLGDFSARGVEPTLRTLGLAELVGRPMSEVLIAVLERVCPPGGTLDEAIARDAYLKAVIECTTNEDGQDVPFSEDVAIQILESFAANSICLRILNDIGTKGLDVAPSTSTAVDVEHQLREFVERAVHDAVERARSEGASLDRIEAVRIAEELYPVTWDLLLTMAEGEEEE